MKVGSPEFEVERFECVVGDSRTALLRVAGRWRADQPVHLSPAALLLDDGQRSHRIAPLPGPEAAAPLAGPDAPTWRAAFSVSVGLLASGHIAFTLDVGDAIVDLPAPREVSLHATRTPAGAVAGSGESGETRRRREPAATALRARERTAQGQALREARAELVAAGTEFDERLAAERTVRVEHEKLLAERDLLRAQAREASAEARAARAAGEEVAERARVQVQRVEAEALRAREDLVAVRAAAEVDAVDRGAELEAAVAAGAEVTGELERVRARVVELEDARVAAQSRAEQAAAAQSAAMAAQEQAGERIGLLEREREESLARAQSGELAQEQLAQVTQRVGELEQVRVRLADEAGRVSELEQSLDAQRNETRAALAAERIARVEHEKLLAERDLLRAQAGEARAARAAGQAEFEQAWAEAQEAQTEARAATGPQREPTDQSEPSSEALDTPLRETRRARERPGVEHITPEAAERSVGKAADLRVQTELQDELTRTHPGTQAVADRVPVLEAAPQPSPGRDGKTQAAADDRRARIFVWGCWALLLVSSSYLVLRAGRNVPIQEDWHVIAAATGHQDGFWSWVWLPNNEHRVPIAKLLYVALLQVWPDFRVGMVFNLAALGAIAASFVVFLRRLRGYTRWSDAFFPLILLNLGNWENLGWSWQLTFVIAAGVALAILMLLATRGGWTTRRASLLTGCLLVTPFTGATALPFAAAVAVAVLLEGRHVAGRPRTVLMAGGATTLLLSGLYFIDLPKSTWVPGNPGLATDALTSGKFLALGLGPAAGVWWLVSVLAVVVALVSAAWLLWRARHRGTLTLLAFLGAGLVLAVSLGRGRAGAVPFYGLPDRYVLVAAPLICAIYLAWDRYGGPRTRRLGPAALCGALLLLLPLNTIYGAQWKDWYQKRVDTFAADVKAGVPLAQLVHYRPLGQDATEMWFGMQYMRQHEIGVFSRLRLVPQPVQGWAIDGFGSGGAGWETLRGPESRARLVTRDGKRVLRWEYNATSRGPAVLGRRFAKPADWRGAGGLAFTVTGQGTQRRVRVRLTLDVPRSGLERFDTWFRDTTAATTTVVMPWNGFGRANVRGEPLDELKGPLPLTGIRSVTFIIGDTGPGVLRISRLALTPGHPQLGWPLHSATQRRSLPPFS